MREFIDSREGWNELEERLYNESVDALLEDEFDDDYESDPFLTDAEADADVLASAGWGTDEDYGCFEDFDW